MLYLLIPVYSTAMQENMNSLLYPGLIEELVDIVELKEEDLVVNTIFYSTKLGVNYSSQCSPQKIF